MHISSKSSPKYCSRKLYCFKSSNNFSFEEWSNVKFWVKSSEVWKELYNKKCVLRRTELDVWEGESLSLLYSSDDGGNNDCCFFALFWDVFPRGFRQFWLPTQILVIRQITPHNTAWTDVPLALKAVLPDKSRYWTVGTVRVFQRWRIASWLRLFVDWHME